MSSAEIQAREDIIRAVLRILANERTEPHAYSDDDAWYADDQLLEAARRLVESRGGEDAAT